MKKLSNKTYRTIFSITIVYSLLFTLIISQTTYSKEGHKFDFPANDSQLKNPETEKRFGQVPVYFEENRGQFGKHTEFKSVGTNYTLFLSATEAVYVLRSPESDVQSPKLDDKWGVSTLDSGHKTQDSPKAVAVFMKLSGANENSRLIGEEEVDYKTNYFKGSDESKWQTNVPNFARVRASDVYQGIDAVWHGKTVGAVQYDFVVAPNANLNQIEWEIEGAESVEIDEKGCLLITTEYGVIEQQKPFTYQATDDVKQEVESRFVIKDQFIGQNSKFKIGFEVGNYDRTKTLTIDPSVNLSNLSFSTFLGGSGNDLGNAIKLDRAGNVYVIGDTSSNSFPTTAGTFDPTHNGNIDVFVTKLNASGSQLIYSTFLGGSLGDTGNDIAIDASGNAFITGFTTDAASDFPTTGGAYDTTHNGGLDVFVTKLNADGSILVYSTFLGGNLDDGGNGIAIDTSGNAFVTGFTVDTLTDFPTTVGAFDTTHNGAADVFTTKLNVAGSALVYSTFLGGNSNDIGYGIAVDASGNAFITGSADDGVTDYPATFGAYDPSHNGGLDAFVTKLNPAGSALSFSTFLGGNALDIGYDIAIDSSGSVFIVGGTVDGVTDFPTTVGAFDVTHNGGVDVFVTKLNATGSSLVYSTFIGGNLTDVGNSIAVSASGNAFITGYTNNGVTDYPITVGAYDTTHNGNDDVFVTKLNVSGSALAYSTFIGANINEQGRGIAIDASDNALITGYSFDFGANYPTTSEVFQPNHNGNNDVIVSKLGDFSISGRTVDTSGIPLPNTAVAMSGDNNGFMLSDANGNFAFTDTVNFGTNLVSATQLLYNFNPPNYEVFVNRNKQITFVGRPTSSGPTLAFASLGGNVQSQVGNTGLPNTKLTLIDAASGNPTVVHTDSNGDYEFEAMLTGSFYLVVPEKEGYQFNPGIYQVNHLDENLGNDFVATPNAPRPVNDFDGDGKTDLAVYRPNEGNWYILESESNNVKIIRFGLEGDIPVASDYDGDNRADIAVYRPSEGNWYRINSSNGEFEAIHFGTVGDKPVQADFDGDGKTDYAVYRPSTGVWHRLLSEDGSYIATKFGISKDEPIAADYDSDGKADLTVYRNGVWYHQMSATNEVQIYQFGLPNDKPQIGDFDGDGTIDTTLYRPSTGVWYWIESSDRDIEARQFGIATDIPTPADYNGDGRYEQSVYRDGIWYVLRNDYSFYAYQFGTVDDIPISSRQ